MFAYTAFVSTDCDLVITNFRKKFNICEGQCPTLTNLNLLNKLLHKHLQYQYHLALACDIFWQI